MMINVRMGKKIANIWGVIIVLVISAGLLVCVSPANAETLKCRLISGLTKTEVNQVGDEEGHVIGMYERKGLMLHENGEVANELNRGVFDSAGGITKWQGYCLQTFKDGSTMWMKHQGTMDKGQIVEASFEFIKGTGRFEGIKGKGTFTGGLVTYAEDHGGYEDLRFTGTYTLEK